MSMATYSEATVGDLKKHKGPIKIWVHIFEEDGEYIQVSKAALLRAIGADVPFKRDGLHDSTPLRNSQWAGGKNTLFIG